jgi:hypothetical protein
LPTHLFALQVSEQPRKTLKAAFVPV